MKKCVIFIYLALISGQVIAQEYSEWRGPGRTGIYNETIMKQWPAEGPEILWFNEELPAGFSSAAIANQKVYITGIVDKMDVLVALDLKGKELWRVEYGRAWEGSYTESRQTPTVENDRIFLSSGKGDVTCVDAMNGRIIWKVEAMDLYGSGIGRWGLAESVLVDENNVFYTTGGNKTTMVALDKKTGNLVWKSEPLNDNPSYTSPLMIAKNGKKQIVNVTENHIFGIDPVSGKLAWKFYFTKYKTERNNHTNTPVYHNGEIFVTTGYNHSNVKLKLNEDLSDVTLCWTDTVFDNHHGGAVKIGDYLYGSNWQHNRMGRWVCIDWNTGKTMYEKEWKNKGSIIAADGMLIIMEEQSGHVGLVKADPNEFRVISSFKVTKGTGPFWAHPVIHNGILYIRHGKALVAYKIG
jgi:outer membrane protein assembly factor BamB